MVLTLTAFHIASLLAAAILLIVAAVNDSRRYKIPNVICAILVALFPVFVLTAPRAIEWQQNLIVFGLVVISGFGMFLGNLAGAGDAKLLAATSLWAGPHFIAVFILTTAIAGGILACVMAGFTYLRNRKTHAAISISRVPIPYGVAIAVGGIGIFYMLSQPILFPG